MSWPAGGGSVGPEAVWGRRLQRTPSRVQVTSDSVYRLPQAEIRVVHTIGEGTFGEVVLATNSVFGKVAVKWLKVSLRFHVLFCPFFPSSLGESFACLMNC